MKSLLLLLLSAWYSKQTTTQYVDDLEIQLRYNRDQYLGGAHTAVRRWAALDAFDSAFAWRQGSRACGSKMLGRAGNACLSD
jgi:protoheme ferro-lyase